ncbi:uncharacterized protein PRCAT00004014001 [Priceomyces carsonii]|uniref:uncharacterized protein n=1 Tax=Priceomyces carsonii TaxID=28549 RepID=UPI002ED9292B|nr:unnamed protein product [Priceomyces carsonii]
MPYRSLLSISPYVLISWVAIVYLIIELRNYDDVTIVGKFKSAFHKGSDSFIFKNRISTNQVLFPKSFELDINEFIKEHPNYFDPKSIGKPKLKRAKDEDYAVFQKHSEYFDHNITIYDSSNEINLNLSRCDGELKQDAKIEIDKAVNVDVSMREVLSNFLKQTESDPYYQEMAPFFIDQLKLQLKYDVVDRFFFRMAGSSVWLEEYGVHFAISRILYSPKGSRNQPIVSLTYAQLYNKEWKELTNTKLVVPTNSLENNENIKGDKNDDYMVLKFPRFLPIPFWHDIDNVEGKYYGPEDPRLMLVKNKRGHMEPLVVFNAYHRKLVHLDDDVDDHILLTPDYYRSMFMCWPWQFQKGKENTDGMPDKYYDNNYYNRVVELRIQNLKRSKKQKNWSPFISYEQSNRYGFDKYVLFVYRWANLEILRCNLEGVCAFSYRLSNRLSPSANIGPFRGGTQLVNVNELLARKKIDVSRILPQDREIWVGFARAHLDKCGCGNNMYRPNLIVLVKDKVMVDNGKDDGEDSLLVRDIYKLSHVSSSISFEIPIIGWDLEHPDRLCAGSNVLLPNGISSLFIESVKFDSKNMKWKSQDFTTVTFSVSDFIVYKVNIRGLLNALFNMEDDSLFLPLVVKEEQDLLKSSKTKLPPKTLDNDLYFNTRNLSMGFNNDNLLCALQGSSDFCKQYGIENDDQNLYLEESPYDFSEEDEEIQDSNVVKYEQALMLQLIQRNIDARKELLAETNEFVPKRFLNMPSEDAQYKKKKKVQTKKKNAKKNSLKNTKSNSTSSVSPSTKNLKSKNVLT